MAVELFQCFALHSELHLGILLHDLRVALAQHLRLSAADAYGFARASANEPAKRLTRNIEAIAESRCQTCLMVEGLAGLAGLQDGPNNALLNGTRYEYDSRLKRTFEVAPSGDRLPVALVAGKFQRDSAKMTAKKPHSEDVF